MRHFMLVLLLPVLLLFGSDSFSTGPVPDWVTATPFSLEAPLKPEQIHIQYLLSEKQSHWGKQTTYCHEAIKITSQTGREFLSELQFNFRPTHQNFVMHTLAVHRGGRWESRLQTSRHQILHREDALEDNLYDGSLTPVYFLTDLRIGDVVEFSYSIIGNDPILHPYHEDELYLERSSPFEKIYYRIIANEALPFYFKPFCTDLSPTIAGPQEWVWESVSTKPYEEEEQTPSYYNPLARIQLTQFRTWNEAVLHLLPHYEQNTALAENGAALALIQEWQSASSNKEQQALMAIHFVQDEVRFFGFLEGIGSCRPAPAHQTFESRSGDCKAKAVLLQALLKILGIDSYPMLVSSPANEMQERLPNISLFNHVVLQIQLDGQIFYVDPTLSLQGGRTLSDLYFPDYAWGLVLAKETTGLTNLPRYTLPKPTQISTALGLETSELAKATTTLTFYGMKADGKRQQLAAKGTKEILEYHAEDLPKKAKLLSQGTITDDRENNQFTLHFFYEVPTAGKGSKRSLALHSILMNHIEMQELKEKRKHPFALFFPFWAKEEIRIENPFNSWEGETFEIHDEQPAFDYQYHFQKEGHVAALDFEIHHFQNSITSEDQIKYRDLLYKLEAPDPLSIVSSSENLRKTKQDPLQ